jgi:hypothetical protein
LRSEIVCQRVSVVNLFCLKDRGGEEWGIYERRENQEEGEIKDEREVGMMKVPDRSVQLSL